MQRLLVLPACVLSLAVSAQAIEVDVVVRPTTKVSDSDPVSGTLLATAVVMKNPQQPKTIALPVPGHATLDLPEGVWRLEIKAPGWFHAGEIVTVGKDKASIILPVWVMGTIQGKAKTSDDVAIKGMTARWSSGTAENAGKIPDGEIPCIVDANEFRCPVPAGVLDLKLRANGYGSHFLWRLKVPQAADLPLIQFKRGGGVYGWVNVGADVPFDRERIRVFLSAATHSSEPTRPVIATINDRGFFAFSGIDPGSYTITASTTKGVGSDQQEIVVRQDGETELLEPLTLHKRLPLRVTITPPLDPAGAAWQVSVTRTGSNRHSPAAKADGAGVATITDLAPGPYDLSILPSDQSTAFARRSIELPGDAVLTVELNTVHLVGTVRLKDSPLAEAVVWVGGKHHNPSVTLKTNADGAFSGTVPFDPETTWTVTVSSRSAPTIERTIRQRPVREDEKTVRLDLVLPAAAIEGVVLDANGSPVTKGSVNVLRTDNSNGELMQGQVRADGHFEIVGLEAGEYTVYAEGSGGRTSERSQLNIDKDDVTSVKLILGAGLRLSGRLITQDGTAVAGARVYVDSVEVPMPIRVPRITSPTGEFHTILPDATRTVEVLVVARGFAFKSFRAPADSKRDLMIRVRQNGGSRALTTPAAEDSAGRIPYLVREAIALPLRFFLSDGLAAITKVDGAVMHSVVQNIEPGAYGLCFMTREESGSPSATRCSFGNLPPFGSLALSISP